MPRTLIPLRPLYLVLLAMCTWQGCAFATVMDTSADANRQREAEATGTAAELVERPPMRGDTLEVRLVGGQTIRGAFSEVATDTLRLSQPDGRIAVRLDEVDAVRRPWQEARYDLALVGGAIVDIVFYYLFLQGALY